MAYHLEETDIVIDGWENGISENPYKGINDMRGVNIISVPGEASVSFAPVSDVLPSVGGQVVSADPTTNIITVATPASGSLHNQQAITFSGAVPTGITVGTVYWIGNLSGNTFKIYTEPQQNNEVDITATGTGDYGSINLGEVKYMDRIYPYAIDANGRAWSKDSTIVSGDFWVYLGNTTLTNASGNGICVFTGSDLKRYLFVFRNAKMDYIYLNTVTWSWSYDWQSFNTAAGTNNPHQSLIGQDSTMYITDSSYVASLFEKSGSTFDPTNNTTYTFTNKALAIPRNDIAQSLEELGRTLLVGGNYNYIYPWDRISTSFSYPIKIADNQVVNMITVNTNCYIFAGKRGRIYVTNGSQANLYSKIPDQISGDVDPIFTWYGCAYNKNQIYFGVGAQKNDKTVITTYAGLWAIDITTNALRVPNLQSTTTGTVTAIVSVQNTSGFGLEVAWKSGTTYGIDTTGATPYASYVGYIDTDIIPVGQYLKKRTFQNIEFKLSQPMANGEAIKISYRTSRTGSFTQIGETVATATYLPFSDYYLMPTDLSQWLQFRIEMKSTATSPSYVRLYELRLKSQ